MAGRSPKLAVLIDGDNISPDIMGQVFAGIAGLGHAAIRNGYGSQADRKKWLDAATRFALSQGRRHLHAGGPNATDIEMVIGAMDIMASDDIDGFCLVSSDSDFTSLAIRLREGGKLVFGFGDKRAPDSLRRACDIFQLIGEEPPAAKQTQNLKHAESVLAQAFDACAVDGWASLSRAMQYIKTSHPDFTPTQYGCAGIKKLVAKCGTFDLQRSNSNDVFRPSKAALSLKLVKA